MKYRLLSPGPTPVPETVLTAMANPMWHHRTPAFEKIFAECREGLRWLFQVDDDVLILSSSGTGGFEAAFQTYFSTGEKVICVGGGKFGERWGQMARKLGLEAIDVPVEWGEAADPGKVEEALKAHPDAKGVVVVASETSTGARHPYEAIGSLVKDRDDTLFLVDGITAVGVWDINPRRDHIDVLVSGSQKAFMLPPGLAFVASSEKAWRRASQATNARYYFDLNKEKKNQAQNQTAYTPAVSLIVGLQESLRLLREEGLEQIFARHHRLARATRAGCEALGLSLFAKVPADSVTSVVSPSEIPPDAVYKGLRDRANITIAGGQDALKGKIFRVAHLGYYDDLDIITVMGALEVVLRQAGWDRFSYGQGVGAALAVLEEGFVAKK